MKNRKGLIKRPEDCSECLKKDTCTKPCYPFYEESFLKMVEERKRSKKHADSKNRRDSDDIS